MRPKGYLTEADYLELAKSLETEHELKVFLNACEAEYMERNPTFYRNLLFGLLRLRTGYVNELQGILKANHDNEHLKHNNIPKAKIDRLDRIKEYLEERQKRIIERVQKERHSIIQAAIDKHLHKFPTIINKPSAAAFGADFMRMERSPDVIADVLADNENMVKDAKDRLRFFVRKSWRGNELDSDLLGYEKDEEFSKFCLCVYTELAKSLQSESEAQEKPDDKEKLTGQEWALYYFYLAESGNYPLLKDEAGKAYEQITSNIKGIKASYFGKEYRKIKNITDRLNGANNDKRIKKILPKLKEYPKALQMAENELIEILNRGKSK